MQSSRLSLLRVGVASVVLVTLTWVAVYIVRLNGWAAVASFGALAFPLVAWLCCLPRPMPAQYWWNALVAVVAVPTIIAVQHVQTNELDRTSIFLLLAIAMSLPALVGIAVGGLVLRRLEVRREQ